MTATYAAGVATHTGTAAARIRGLIVSPNGAPYTPDAGWVLCDHPGCLARIKNNSWARIKSEWFFRRDGQAWCPDHFPEWVAEWRARNV